MNEAKTQRLQGKSALVTGGSRGIGAAIAEAFAREGARVIIVARKAEELEATAARINDKLGEKRVFAKAGHTGRPDVIGELFAWIDKEHGALDIAVNNAATNPYFGPLLNVEWSAWDKTFDLNLKGYFEVARQTAKRLLASNRGGAIVNVASVVGLRGFPMQGVYAMSKAAVISMTQTLARRARPRQDPRQRHRARARRDALRVDAHQQRRSVEVHERARRARPPRAARRDRAARRLPRQRRGVVRDRADLRHRRRLHLRLTRGAWPARHNRA